MYYVYRITNMIENHIPKYYYGFRKCNGSPYEDKKYMGSSKYLKNDVVKYGIENFSKKILKIFNNKEEAIDYEIMLHNKFEVHKNVMFYNKCKASKFGYKCTGDILKGKSYEELYGHEYSNKLKKDRSNAMKIIASNRDYRGEKNPNYGNSWTEQMKNDMSVKKSGSKNPIYNKIIINNGEIEKRISKEEPIPNGYVVGRVLKKDFSHIIEDYIKSGLSRKEYSIKTGINYNTLKRYLRGITPLK